MLSPQRPGEQYEKVQEVKVSLFIFKMRTNFSHLYIWD